MSFSSFNAPNRIDIKANTIELTGNIVANSYIPGQSAIVTATSSGGAVVTEVFRFSIFSPNLAQVRLTYVVGDGTATNTIQFSDIIPTAFRPSFEVNSPILVINNNAFANGLIRIGANGTVAIVILSGNFTASPATNGLCNCVVSYPLS